MPPLLRLFFVANMLSLLSTAYSDHPKRAEIYWTGVLYTAALRSGGRRDEQWARCNCNTATKPLQVYG